MVMGEREVKVQRLALKYHGALNSYGIEILFLDLDKSELIFHRIPLKYRVVTDDPCGLLLINNAAASTMD